MPKSRTRSRGHRKGRKGSVPPRPRSSASVEEAASPGRPRRERGGFFERRHTFRSSSEFKCEKCKKTVHKGDYIGTVQKGVGYRKLCESCFWKVRDASRELVGEDTRKPWMRWLHAGLMPLVLALYILFGIVVIATIISVIQILIVGTS